MHRIVCHSLESNVPRLVPRMGSFRDMECTLTTVSSEELHVEESRQVTSLFDALLAGFDALDDCASVPKPAIQTRIPDVPSSFSRFPDLPLEIQDQIFEMALEPYVVKVYTQNLWKVNAKRAATIACHWRAGWGTQLQGHNRKLSPRAAKERLASQVLFIDHRPVCTVPLFQVNPASRRTAMRRYGQPSPQLLLFNPTIDRICLCGKTPSNMASSYWHVFGLDQKHVYDFSQTRSAQLRFSAFSTRTGTCFPPEKLFSKMTILESAGEEDNTVTFSSSLRVIASLLKTLDWLESYMPQIEKLEINLTDGGRHGWSKSSLSSELKNLRNCIARLEESEGQKSERFCLPQLKRLSISM